MITFLGTGLLGSGFVRALLRRGEAVHVWNRTVDKARALEAAGARVFDDPADAVRGAARVHSILSDDAAVDGVLDRAAPGLSQGVMLVDHTTTSPTGTVARLERWKGRGHPLVHAPVFMGPQNALDSTGIMLVSGERALVESVKPHLDRMTGKVVDLGDRPDAGAAYKLLGNLFLMFVTGGLTDFFTLGRAMGIEPRDAASLFAHFNPGLSVGARIDRMLAADWAKASWELGMARKDARLMIEAGEEGTHPLSFLPVIAAKMDDMLARGHSHDDWTVLAKDAIEKP